MRLKKYVNLFLALSLVLLSFQSCVDPEFEEAALKDLEGNEIQDGDNGISGHGNPQIEFVNSESSVLEGTNLVQVRVRLNQAVNHAVTADFIIQGANGAVMGQDFELLGSTSVFIQAGQREGMINLRINEDQLRENAEQVLLVLQQSTDIGLGQRMMHRLSIIDKQVEVPANVGFLLSASNTVENIGILPVQIQLDKVASAPVRVNFQFLGSAQKGSDYVVSGNEFVIIPAGQTTGMLNLVISDDNAQEQLENIIISISGVEGASLSAMSALHVVNITDNDQGGNVPPPPAVMPRISFALQASQRAENSGLTNLVVSLDQAASSAVSFSIIALGTATENQDFLLSSKQGSIPAGQTQTAIPVTIIDDNNYEGDENVQIVLQNVQGALLGAVAAHMLTIQENDQMPAPNPNPVPPTPQPPTPQPPTPQPPTPQPPTPQPPQPQMAMVAFSQVSSSVVEGQSLQVQVALDQAASSNVSFQIGASGSATSGSDFNLSASSVTIPAGQVSGSFSINTIDDNEYEQNGETITLIIMNPQNAQVGAIAVHQVVLQDNDQAPNNQPPAVSSAQAFDQTLYPILRMNCAGCHGNSGFLPNFASADLNTAHSIATRPEYINLSNPATSGLYTKIVANHQGRGALAPQILSAITEWAGLLAPANPPMGNVPAVLSFNSANSIVTESNSSSAVLVSLDKAAAGPVSFSVSMSGAASYSQDYTLASTQLTIAAGQTSATIVVNILDDNVIEMDEDIVLVLSNISGANLGSNIIHYKRITDNDQAAQNLSPEVQAFNETLYPVLRNRCGSCHFTGGPSIGYKFAEPDVTLSHVNIRSIPDAVDFANAAQSRIVIKQTENGGHNCSGADCQTRANELQAQIIAWTQRLAAIGIVPGGAQGQAIVSGQSSFALAGASEGQDRVTQDLIALYEFKQGNGNVAFDTSGVAPAMTLSLENTEWVEGGGLKFNNDSIGVANATNSKKLHDRIAGANGSGQFTIEAWVTPANQTDDGPARLVTYSRDTGIRNFTLGQTLYNYNFRNRSSLVTSNNGTPSLDTKGNADAPVLKTSLQHVVVTFGGNGKGRTIYIDGQLYDEEQANGTPNVNLWNDDFQFAIGNEITRNRDFEGTFRLVAVYNRALSAGEVNQNFRSGFVKKYNLEFDIAAQAGAGAKIALTVSEFDGYAYLFEKPRFVGVPSGSGVRLKGMSIAINGKQPTAGQAYRNLDMMIQTPNQSLSDLDTVILKDQGTDNDMFTLEFEMLGNSSNVVSPTVVSSEILFKATEDSSMMKGINGMRTFEEIFETMAAITGVNPGSQNVNSTYRELKTQLPLNSDIETFLAANQVGIAKLSLEFCDSLIEDSNLRSQFFPGFNFGQNAVSAFGNQAQRDIIIDNIYTKMIGDGLSNQPQKSSIQTELGTLITDLTQGCSANSCPAERTRTIVKASCAAVLGSAAVSVK